ncbi:MAG TPA: DUF484 family protein [Alphaproteobacteria bacterium]|jgi:hypothetical protein|nr:DUF484 family protein [Alphaproteobacteria bacterium]
MKNPRENGTAPRKLAQPAPKADEGMEAAIVAYLVEHPDFVERHPALIQTLTPPTIDRGRGVVDFQRFMVARLQGDIDQLNVENTALIHTARANAHSQSRIHAAVLALLEARSLGQLLEILTGDLMDLLDVDVIAMVVESNGADLPHVAASGIRIVEPGAVEEWLGQRSALLQGGVAGDPAIYGPGAGLIQSEALLRLNISSRTPAGLVAFGSRDPNLFQEGQGTELIAFLGGAIERLLRAWLDLPV